MTGSIRPEYQGTWECLVQQLPEAQPIGIPSAQQAIYIAFEGWVSHQTKSMRWRTVGRLRGSCTQHQAWQLAHEGHKLS